MKSLIHPSYPQAYLVMACIILGLLFASCKREEPQPKVDINNLRGELIEPATSQLVTSTSNALAISNQIQSLLMDGTNQSKTKSRSRQKPGSYPKRLVEMRTRILSQGGDALTNLVDNALVPYRTNLPPPQVQGYRSISFQVLGNFDFEVKDELLEAKTNPGEARAAVMNQIPAEIRSLNGVKCAISGFLVPLLMDEGLAVQFLLMRDQTACCYGLVPQINEWISVRVTGSGVKPQMDKPITICGTLLVNDQRENGYLVSLYQFEADKVIF